MHVGRFYWLVIPLLIGLIGGDVVSASTLIQPQQNQFSTGASAGQTDFFSFAEPQLESSNATNVPEAFPGFQPSAAVGTDFLAPNENPSSGRPRGVPIGLEAEWIADSDVGLATYGTNLKVPLLFVSKSPPPIAKIGFAYTDFSAPDSLGIPDDLYEVSLGLSWVKRYNQRWAVRTMLGVDFATDHRNTSSDAWRFTGGIFAIYKNRPQISWTFGVLALGRSDLPAVPAVGAVWLPNPTTRIDMILPNPKANFMLSDDGRRQHWAYLGGGINGNTWAFEQPNQVDDTLTYSDLRLVAGWESRPSAPADAPFVVGRKYIVEVGYAFSRDLEFENDAVEISLDDAVTFRLSTQY